jgi:hypothetical protein
VRAQPGFLTTAGKGGALAPPLQGSPIVVLPRPPHSPSVDRPGHRRADGLCGRRREKRRGARDLVGGGSIQRQLGEAYRLLGADDHHRQRLLGAPGPPIFVATQPGSRALESTSGQRRATAKA